LGGLLGYNLRFFIFIKDKKGQPRMSANIHESLFDLYPPLFVNIRAHSRLTSPLGA